MEHGLTSDSFDIGANVRSGDLRALDDAAKAEIRAMMLRRNMSFDEARLEYFRGKMKDNGIGSNGVPTDPRTVTFS